MWLDFSQPLPLLEAARRGSGFARASTPWSASAMPATWWRRPRRRHGANERRCRSRAARHARPAAGAKVEIELGDGRRSDGLTRSLSWKHTYWIALPLLMPVAMEIVEAADGLPRQHTRYELIAIDQLSLAEAAAGGSPGAPGA
ncbi:MAG: hypothetical protein U1F25_03435 [Rubrivivax sp.]